MNKVIVSAALASAFVASPVMAADFSPLLQPAPIAYVAPTADWTGFYAGVFAGVSNGPFDFSIDPAAPPLNISINGGGVIGGAQVGYDVQFNQFVLGAVADIGVSNHRVGAAMTLGPDAVNIESRLSYLGTVRARAGYAFDDLLAYAHGGLAYGRTETSLTVNGTPVALGVNNPDRIGYVVGAGFEYQVTENISLQTEYSYTGFGNENLFDFGPAKLNQSLSFHTVKAGVNFRF